MNSNGLGRVTVYVAHASFSECFSSLCLPLSALRQHDLVDEVDDGRSRLVGVQLSK